MSSSVEGGHRAESTEICDLISSSLYFHEWLSYRPSYSIYKNTFFFEFVLPEFSLLLLFFILSLPPNT